MGPKICLFFAFLGVIFWTLFWTLFGQLLGPFWGPFWDQIGPRRSQDEPKRAIKSFKVQKSYIFKNLKKPLVFEGFWGPEASQERLMRPKRAPKRHPKSPKASKKRDPKMDPKIDNFWTNFGFILVAILGPKTAPKWDQKWVHFWNPSAPPLRGPGLAILGIKREW